MRIFHSLFRRWPTLNLPVACLLAFLQRTPVVRVAMVAEEFILSSPVGTVLKSAVAAFGTLGVVHSLAGATQFVISPSANVSGTVGKPLSVAFTITGSPTPPFFFTVSQLPPGLVTNPASTNGVVNSGTPTITGTPTKAGFYSVNISGSDGLFSMDSAINFNIAEGAAVAPAFTTQPASQTVNVGANVVLTVAASGSPAPTLQWQKNGAALAGATNATLTLPNVQTGDTGNYSCVATNSAGSVTSNAVALTVNAVTAASAITTQPASKTVSIGSTAVFAIAASGIPAPTFQWRKDGVAVAGATSSTLIISAASAANSGTYTCVATNTSGSVTSNGANLAVSATPDFGRISNLSILTTLSTTEGLFTVGTVIGGAGTSGNKPLVIRAGGPALGAAPFNIPGVLPDPKFDVFSGSTIIASNDNWGGAAGLTTAIAAVGAFPFSATSRDAATNPTLAPGGYTIQIKDSGGAGGLVIAELYDATPNPTFAPTTSRLINVSVNKQIEAGAILTAGFVIGGSTAKSVLIRVVGPTLGAAPFNVPGVMADPKLDLFSDGTIIASNDNWGGDPQLTAVAVSVGAFALVAPTSKDAMLLITLAPGAYTVQASGVGGSGGVAIVEVYEVP